MNKDGLKEHWAGYLMLAFLGLGSVLLYAQQFDQASRIRRLESANRLYQDEVRGVRADADRTRARLDAYIHDRRVLDKDLLDIAERLNNRLH